MRLGEPIAHFRRGLESIASRLRFVGEIIVDRDFFDCRTDAERQDALLAAVWLSAPCPQAERIANPYWTLPRRSNGLGFRARLHRGTKLRLKYERRHSANSGLKSERSPRRSRSSSAPVLGRAALALFVGLEKKAGSESNRSGEPDTRLSVASAARPPRGEKRPTRA